MDHVKNSARRSLQGQGFEQLGLSRAVRTRNHAETPDPRHSVTPSARLWASFGDRRSPAHWFASSIRGDADEHAIFQDVARQPFFRETLTDLSRRGRKRSIEGLQSEFTSDGSRHGEWIMRLQGSCQQRSADRRLAATVEAERADIRRIEETQGFQRVLTPFANVITARNVDIGDSFAERQATYLHRPVAYHNRAAGEWRANS